jgi:hypothetical protein
MDPFVGFVVPLRVLRSGQELIFYYYDYTSSPMLRAYDPLSGKCRGVETPTKLLAELAFAVPTWMLDFVALMLTLATCRAIGERTTV